MKKLILIMTITILTTTASSTQACGAWFRSIFCKYFDQNYIKGSGVIQVEERESKHFDKIKISGFGNAIIKQTNAESIKIETDSNILPIIETSIYDNTLTIGIKEHCHISPTKLIFHINVKNIKMLETSGTISVKTDTLVVDNLKISDSGASSIKIERLESGNLDVNIAGAGSVTVDSGFTNTQKINISGAGSFNGSDFKSNNCKAYISGCCSAKVNAIKLKSRIAGFGSVKNYGK